MAHTTPKYLTNIRTQNLLSAPLQKLRRGGFDPSQIEGLALWLDPSAADSLYQDAAGTIPATTGDPVGFIRDRSGNGRHATQSTAASRPTVTTVNGRAALSPDGGDALAVTQDPTFVDGSHTVFMAMEANAGVNAITYYVGRAADADNYRVLRGAGSVAGTLGVMNLNTKVPTEGSMIFSFRRESGTGETLRTFGTVVDSYEPGTDPSATTVISLLARQRASGAITAGDTADIYEVIAYDRALTDAESRRVEVYLANRWGITLAPQVDNAEAQDWVDRVYAAGSTVSQPVANAVSDFVTGCQSDGIWDAMKSVVLLAGADTLAGALAPLKGTAPTSYNFASGDYSQTSGLKGNGSTTYLDSNRATNADPQNSMHIAVWPTEIGTTTRRAAGSYAPGLSDEMLDMSGDVRCRSYDTVANVSVSTNHLYGVSRSSSTSWYGRGSEQNVSGAAYAGISPNSRNVFMFGYNNNGVLAYSASARLSFYSIGESLDLALLDARVSTLMSDLGVS